MFSAERVFEQEGVGVKLLLNLGKAQWLRLRDGGIARAFLPDFGLHLVKFRGEIANLFFQCCSIFLRRGRLSRRALLIFKLEQNASLGVEPPLQTLLAR